MATPLKHFSPEEFFCKCGKVDCNALREIDPELGVRLDTLRESLGRAIRITSAIRCRTHNTAVGGATDSTHILGKAADILVKSSSERFELERHLFCHPVPLFRRIGHAGSHLHVDVGDAAIDLTWIEGGT